VNIHESWLIAVTAGKWQRHAICEARAAGLKVLALDTDPHAEGFAVADHILNTDLSDHEAIIRQVKSLGKNIQGAVSFVSEAGMMLAARLREEFNLPGPRTDLALRLLDKAVQRKIWMEQGVPGPRWEVFDHPDMVVAAISRFGFPLIIKPTDASGSRGVTKLESVADDLQGAVCRAFQFSKSGKVIMESYMAGTEFTVEVFAVGGTVHVLAVTEKKKVAGTRGTVARELATPDRPAEIVTRIADTVVAAYRALGYLDGPGHAEAILMADGSVGLVEAAGRGGGFMIFDELIPAVSGVNIARATALQAVGQEVGTIENRKQAAVLRFFPSRPGILRKISGFESANSLAGVIAAPFAKVGNRFHQATVDGDRLGYILSRAPVPRLARDLADKAESLICFEIEGC